jgi:hypothetical protein
MTVDPGEIICGLFDGFGAFVDPGEFFGPDEEGIKKSNGSVPFFRSDTRFSDLP